MSGEGNEHRLWAVGEADEELIRLVTEDDYVNCRITCTVRGARHVAEAGDFFEALRTLRRGVLEPMGLIPRCYGASLTVWPSGMARDMGRGLMAYRLEPGEPAGELVGIFDTGDDVMPATVAAQERHARAWYAATIPLRFARRSGASEPGRMPPCACLSSIRRPTDPAESASCLSAVPVPPKDARKRWPRACASIF